MLLVARSSPILFCAVFDPVLTSTPAHIFVSGYFNPAHRFYFVRVAFQPIILSSVLTLPYICQFVHSFALQWLPTLILLGTSAHQIFGLCLLSLNFQI
jgi:hypothetical protein